MASLSMADIERIFRHQGWQYDLTDDDGMTTEFNGVVMLIEVDRGCPAFEVTAGIFITNEANMATALAHGQDVDMFLAMVNYYIADARYYRNRETSTVLYTYRTRVRTERLDGITLARALANAVDAATTFKPLIDNMIHDRLSLQQALDTLARAIHEAEEERVRSA